MSAIQTLLQRLAGDSLVRAKILGIARHAASSLAGIVGAWLAAHGADQSTTADVTQGTVLILSALASYGFSLWDKSNVSQKIEEAKTEGLNEQSLAAARTQSGT